MSFWAHNDDDDGSKGRGLYLHDLCIASSFVYDFFGLLGYFKASLLEELHVNLCVGFY
jgi:hypothetical protein